MNVANKPVKISQMASSENLIYYAQNSWCRVCLANDVKLHWIKNTRLLEVYEKLASTRLNAEDGRPHTICYICYSQLQRCCRFSDMCHKSEQFLREHLLHGTEQGEVPPTEITHNLTVTALQFTSIDSSSQEDNEVEDNEVEVKEELIIKEEVIEVKEEPINIEESTLVEDATIEFNIGLEKPQEKVNTELNNEYILPCMPETQIDCNKKRYACTRCQKTFTNNSHLKRHMRGHTGENLYDCNMCNKTFTQKITLQIHMRIHTGEKPYACNMCNKTFTQRSTLQKHMRTHTGEKPYGCNMCTKFFAVSSSLHNHMRTHTGEKPYACNMCIKSFALRSRLQNHMKTHTGESQQHVQ